MPATSAGDRTALRRSLRVATGPDPTRQATRRVVRHCYRIARATLRQQQRTRSLREDVLGEDVGDLAMDAIAGLFERDEQGRFPELRRHFDGQLDADYPEAKLEEDLRRLVQSAVSDWLFEAYRAADRSLSNQIRSVKRAVRQREGVRVRRKGSVQWVEISEEQGGSQTEKTSGRKQRPSGRPMPLQVLEAHLTSAIAEACSTSDLLDTALDTLRDHPDYEAAYPLTRLAQALRSARVRVQSVTEHSEPTTQPERPLLRPDETEHYIEQTLAALQTEKRETYVGQGKLIEEAYAAYFRALRDRLEARFVPPGDPEMTHYEALSDHLPELKKEEYRERHRSRFEYLDRQAREKLVDRLEEVI